MRETEMVFSALEREPIEIDTIYIGGGTPSLINPEHIEDWLTLIKSFSSFGAELEFTIEVNAKSLTAEFAVRAFEAGLNRIVIGVQSFNEKTLDLVGRKQKSKDIYKAFYNARMAGFINIGADLIFGLPGQTIKQMRYDVERVMALEPTHISFYQLTVEDDTRLKREIDDGKIKTPIDDRIGEMYNLGSHILQDKKYVRYEISSFAREGYQARHNISYWIGAPYLGFGAAAHGYINNHRYCNIPDAQKYLEMTESGVFPFGYVESLSRAQRFSETVMLSLRTSEGIDKKELLHQYGEIALDLLEGPETAKLITNGFLDNRKNRLCLMDKAYLVSDEIIAKLLA